MPPKSHSPKWELQLKELEKPLRAVAEDSCGSLTDFCAAVGREWVSRLGKRERMPPGLGEIKCCSNIKPAGERDCEATLRV